MEGSLWGPQGPSAGGSGLRVEARVSRLAVSVP